MGVLVHRASPGEERAAHEGLELPIPAAGFALEGCELLRVVAEQEEERVQERIGGVEKTIEMIREELTSTGRKLDARQNEYNLTKSLVENLEGFPEAIKFLKKKVAKNAPLLSDILTTSEEFRVAIENYLECFRIVHGVADYIAVNISSPNTPGLRELQRADHLVELLGALTNENERLGEKPLLVKIAPDLSDQEIEAAAETCTAQGIAGIIATNTTIGRTGLRSAGVEAIGDGGGVLHAEQHAGMDGVFDHVQQGRDRPGPGGVRPAETFRCLSPVFPGRSGGEGWNALVGCVERA